MQFPANVPGRAAKDGPSTGVPVIHMGKQEEAFLTSGFGLAQTYLGNKPAGGRNLSFLLPLLCHYIFPINIFFKKNVRDTRS